MIAGDGRPPYPWTGQIASIEIGLGDAVSDDGQMRRDFPSDVIGGNFAVRTRTFRSQIQGTMATQADVRRIALSMPGAEEANGRFAFEVWNKDKLKGFVWVWNERVHPKRPKVPNPGVIAVRVANLTQKDLLISAEPGKFFTEPHYNGFPAVLVRLAAVSVEDLEILIEEAWRCQSPAKAAKTAKAAKAAKATKATKAGKTGRPAKATKVGKAAKATKVGKAAKATKVGKAAKPPKRATRMR